MALNGLSMKIFTYILSLFSFLLVLISINTNIELNDFLYYLGGSRYYASHPVIGKFETDFLIHLTITNIIFIFCFFSANGKSIRNNLMLLFVNLILVIFNFNFLQYRTFQGYVFDKNKDSILKAADGDGFLFNGLSDETMLLIISTYIVIYFYQKYFCIKKI
ncbi:hypothetical protein [Thiofilum flexile]|uniref:hypothetical protein n=1 Tax=Thiofilum flexile TaxID=125627 RepID=UPI0013A5ABA9|nr:hypothetical protein [Thiofilum flexile]